MAVVNKSQLHGKNSHACQCAPRILKTPLSEPEQIASSQPEQSYNQYKPDLNDPYPKPVRISKWICVIIRFREENSGNFLRDHTLQCFLQIERANCFRNTLWLLRVGCMISDITGFAQSTVIQPVRTPPHYLNAWNRLVAIRLAAKYLKP